MTQYGVSTRFPDAGLQIDGFYSTDVFELFRCLLEKVVRRFNLPGIVITVCFYLMPKLLKFFVYYLPHTKIFVFNEKMFGFYYGRSMILVRRAVWTYQSADVLDYEEYWKEQFFPKKVCKLQELSYKAFENEVFATRLVYFLNHTLNLKGLYISLGEVEDGKRWRPYESLTKGAKRTHFSPISLAKFVKAIVNNEFTSFDARVKMYCFGPHLFPALCKLLTACHRLVRVRLDVWRLLIVVPQCYGEVGTLPSTHIVLINHEPLDSLNSFEYFDRFYYTSALNYLQNLPNFHRRSERLKRKRASEQKAVVKQRRRRK